MENDINLGGERPFLVSLQTLSRRRPCSNSCKNQIVRAVACAPSLTCAHHPRIRDLQPRLRETLSNASHSPYTSMTMGHNYYPYRTVSPYEHNNGYDTHINHKLSSQRPYEKRKYQGHKMPRQPGQTESRRSSLPKEMTRSQSQHAHDYMTIAYHNIFTKRMD